MFSTPRLLTAMLSSVLEAWDPRYLPSDTVARTISIETHEIASGRFKLGRDQIDTLRSWGYETTRRFFSVPRDYFNSFGVAPIDAPSSVATS